MEWKDTSVTLDLKIADLNEWVDSCRLIKVSETYVAIVMNNSQIDSVSSKIERPNFWSFDLNSGQTFVRSSATLTHLEILDLEINLEYSRKLTLTIDDETLLKCHAKGQAEANTPEDVQQDKITTNIEIDEIPKLEDSPGSKNDEVVSGRKKKDSKEDDHSKNTVVKLTFLNKLKNL